MSTTTTDTREAWLERALTLYEAEVLFPHTGRTLPPWRVAVGFPPGTRGAAPGALLAPARSADGRFELFVSPTVAAGGPEAVLQVAFTLADCASRGEAAPKAKEGIRAWHNVEAEDVASILAAVGPYPAAAVLPPAKTQGTRMLKVTCGRCSWSCRTTKKHLSALVLPAICPACAELALDTEAEA